MPPKRIEETCQKCREAFQDKFLRAVYLGGNSFFIYTASGIDKKSYLFKILTNADGAKEVKFLSEKFLKGYKNFFILDPETRKFWQVPANRVLE